MMCPSQGCSAMSKFSTVIFAGVEEDYIHFELMLNGKQVGDLTIENGQPVVALFWPATGSATIRKRDLVKLIRLGRSRLKANYPEFFPTKLSSTLDSQVSLITH